MNNKITGTGLHTVIQLGHFKFLKMLYRVIQTELLQEPVFAQCGGIPPFAEKICLVVFCGFPHNNASKKQKNILLILY